MAVCDDKADCAVANVCPICKVARMSLKWMFAIAVSFASISSAGTKMPMEASLCAIVRDPMAYNGKVVSFRAGVLTDWHHGIQLFVKGCRGGIQLFSTDHVPSTEALALDDAIGTPLNGGYDRTVFATFTGRIVWRHVKQRSQFFNPLAVDVYRVSRIQVQPRTSPR